MAPKPAIKYPTQRQWERKFTRGIKTTVSGLTTSPAVGAVMSAMGAEIERITGKSLGELVGENAANLVAKLSREFMNGTFKLSASTIKQIGQAAGAIASIVPIFAAAFEMGMDALDQAQAAQDARLQKQTQSVLNYCRKNYVQAKGTGSGGVVTPADLFRPLYESQQRGPQLISGAPGSRYVYPLTATSLFAALCGDASPLGWNRDKRKKWTPPEGRGSAGGATVREYIVHEKGKKGYEQFMRQQRQRTGNGKLGLPREVRLRLAVVIEGIMASVRPWTLEKIEPVGDQGRALFPVLADVLLHAYRAKQWDEAFLVELQKSQIRCYSVIDYQTGALVEPVIDLSADFMQLIGGWKNTIELASAEIGPATNKIMTMPRVGTIIKIRQAQKKPKRRWRTVVPVVLGAVAAAVVAKRLAK